MCAPCVGGPKAVRMRRHSRRRLNKMATDWQRKMAAVVRALATTWLLTSAIASSRASPVVQHQSDSDGEAGGASARPSATAAMAASPDQLTVEDRTTAAIVKYFSAPASGQKHSSTELSSSSGEPFHGEATSPPPLNRSSVNTPAKASRPKPDSSDVDWTTSASSVAPGFYVLVAILVVGPLAICCGVGWYHCSDVCLYFLCPGKMTAPGASAAAGASTSGTESRDRNPVLALRRAIHRRRAAAGGPRRVSRTADGASASAMSDMSPYEVIRYIALSMHNSAGQQEQQQQQQQWLQVPTAAVHEAPNRACEPADEATATAAGDETAEMVAAAEWGASSAATATAIQRDKWFTTAAMEINDETAFADSLADQAVVAGDNASPLNAAAQGENDR